MSQTQVWTAMSPQLAGPGGVAREDRALAAPADEDESGMDVHAHAVDPEQAARSWTLSAGLTGRADAFAHA